VIQLDQLMNVISITSHKNLYYNVH
ncbi:uncharacterized protein METZ01_LOCUS224967, partial [marine metagenome]